MNIRAKNTDLLEENRSGTLLDIGLGDDFLDLTPTPKATKAKMNEWDSIRLISSCAAKKTIGKMERQDIFANPI